MRDETTEILGACCDDTVNALKVLHGDKMPVIIVALTPSDNDANLRVITNVENIDCVDLLESALKSVKIDAEETENG